ncbi:helix-turn-helix domain-containing protein [Vandammella animalimorsus]|nr:helix-turn-helix domain-containing protein [Vandammella animalimorsus]
MSPNYFPPDVIERARALRVNPPAGVDDPAIAFACALGRLKFCLRVSKDKEVADMLGIGEKAFNARKKRNSFPEKKLRALAQRRPELGIDVDWVLTGVAAELPVVVALTAEQAHILQCLDSLSERSRQHIIQTVLSMARIERNLAEIFPKKAFPG